MNSVSPVLTETQVEAEHVVALDQPEYFPIICLRVIYLDADGNTAGGATLTRYQLSAEEREAIAKGADLVISQPHHGPVMPLALQLAFPNSYPIQGAPR